MHINLNTIDIKENMKIESIKTHLRPYSIFGKRKTTINHTFASAIAPNDSYDINLLKKAIVLLGQNPEKDLKCVYCDKPAKTWDHAWVGKRFKVFWIWACDRESFALLW